MVLYPNENEKFYLGYAQARGFRNLDEDGKETTAGGPTRRDTLTLAYGHAFTNRFFATGTAPILRNYLNGDTRGSWGDPALAARYTLVMPTMAETWRPQVQLALSCAHRGKSERCSTSSAPASPRRKLALIFGTGCSTSRAV